ncbi:MAG: HAD-IIIC family phosphatase [Acidobacteriota bacterium]|nr:HAD-IIIC family phosphatase [Acidobacteriota bacterium]
MAQSPFRFVLSANFTAEPVEPALRFWGERLETPFEVRFAPYSQIIQTLVSASSEFALNPHGLNAVLARVEDLGEMRRLERNFIDLLEALRSAAERMPVPLVFVLCPPSAEFLAEPEGAALSHSMAQRAEALLADTPGLHYLSHEEIERLYPVANPGSAEGEQLGRIPYSDLYFCALGTALVRLTQGLNRPPFKVIALDCDNTLWKGICGEDGPRGVVVDEARCALQKFMVDQHEAGTLLVMASKNNEQDVLETFAQNPEMPLKLRHFVSWRLNWDSKAVNLVGLAEELSAGLDSFIFIDDNPKEIAEAAENVPQVLSLALPDRVDRIGPFLQQVWAFDHWSLTQEDRNRNAYYTQGQEFGRAWKQAEDLKHFMDSLELTVRIEPLGPDQLPRAAQLTQRTNQFNFSGIRRTEAELQKALNEGGLEGLTISVADRFGDYGLTGLVLFRAAGGSLEIETFLLSCRVLGRGVEHAVLRRMAQLAIARRLDTLVLRFTPTERNKPAAQFLKTLGETPLLAAALQSLEWQPQEQPEPAPPRTAPSIASKRPDYAAIANTLGTPERILAAMRSEAAYAENASFSETEQRLARIWGELLGRPPAQVTDNFFDLGGHSLLMVRLIMRVRESFGIQLAVDDVYSANLTLGDLARTVDSYQMPGAGEYEALLREIEEMPDEEVRRLLNET